MRGMEEGKEGEGKEGRIGRYRQGGVRKGRAIERKRVRQ